MTIGEQMRAIRTAKGIRQVDVAEAIGTLHTRISQYEHNKYTPSAARIPAICRALGCDPNTLYGWDNPTKDN